MPTSEEFPPSASSGPQQGSLDRPLGRSVKATTSLVLGLLPFVPRAWLLALTFGADSATLDPCLYFIDIVAALLAIIFGHWAKASIRRSGERLHGRGMAIAGLVLGYLWLGGSIVVILISAFISHSRVLANQAAALGSLRTINTAAITYKSTYNRGYPPTLAALGPPSAGNSNSSAEPSEKAAGLIDEYLAASLKSNYRFTYIPGPADSAGKIQTYTVRADPLEPGVSGKMYYFTDQTGVIRVEKSREANQNSPPIK